MILQDGGDERTASGLKWFKWLPVGKSPSSAPKRGAELVNLALSQALATKELAGAEPSFTEEEWATFKVSNLCTDHFVKSGDWYFKPHWRVTTKSTLDLDDLALLEVFLRLTAGGLCSAMEVCLQWRDLATWDVAWTNVCEQVGVRGAGRDIYRKRMEAMVADKRLRSVQGRECCVYDDLVLDDGRSIGLTRYQYATMSAKYAGPDINSFRTRGAFSVQTDRFVQIEFHLVYFRDEQFVGFIRESRKDLDPANYGTAYGNGRHNKRMRFNDDTSDYGHYTKEAVPEYYNGARLSVRIDFEEDSCTWWLNGELQYKLQSLPAEPLHLVAGPDYEGDVTHMKPFTSSTTDWLSGAAEDAVQLMPRRGDTVMPQFTDWKNMPLALHPTPSERLAGEGIARQWIKSAAEEQQGEERGALTLSMLWLLPTHVCLATAGALPMFMRKFFKLAAANLRTVGVAGATFAHTLSGAVLVAAAEQAGLELDELSLPPAPCALVLKPHDEKLMIISHLELMECNAVDLEKQLAAILADHIKPKPSFPLSLDNASTWVNDHVGTERILIIALLDAEFGLEALTGITDRSHEYRGPRYDRSKTFSVDFAHTSSKAVLDAAITVVKPDVDAAMSQGALRNGAVAPCVFLIKPFDKKVALLPRAELEGLGPSDFQQLVRAFLQEEWDPKPSEELSSTRASQDWASANVEENKVAIVTLLEGNRLEQLLDVYMRVADKSRGIAFAHTTYDNFFTTAAATAGAPIDAARLLASRGVLLLKPFDEKFAILPAERLAHLDAAALESQLLEFVEANRQPKPSQPIATADLLQSWAKERVEKQEVAVLALLDIESRAGSLMRVGGSDEMRRLVKFAHTSDAALLTAAAAIADVPLPEALPAPCFLLLKPFDEKYALLPASELSALDDDAFEARLCSFVKANWQPKPSCPVDDGALAASWAAERVAKRELALVALFAADGPLSLVDVYMQFVGGEGVKGVTKAAHTTEGASFQAAATAIAELAAGVAAAPAVPWCCLRTFPLLLFGFASVTAAPCIFVLKPFDETYALLPASELAALDDAGFEARLRSFFDANKQPKQSFHLATVEAATAWAADREAAGAVTLVALLPADAPGKTDAYMSVVLQPAVKGKVSFAHATDAAVFAAAARDAGPFDAPCAHMANFQLASDVTAERLPASELAALDGGGLKVRRVPSSRMCPRVLSPTCTRAQARLLRLCADNLLPRGLRDVGVSTPTPPAMAPNATVGPSNNTHNILTVTEGVLVARVEFGTGGDDDQFLGVLQEAAPDRAQYGHLLRLGWCVGSNQPAMAEGSRVGGERWHIKGSAVTMFVDVARASVSFWSDGAHATLSTGLPPNTPLTAALGLYQNTATVTALRHVPPGSADPLLAGVRGGAAGGTASSAGGGGADDFGQMDTNGDGLLSMEEVRAYVRAQGDDEEEAQKAVMGLWQRLGKVRARAAYRALCSPQTLTVRSHLSHCAGP